MTNEEKALLAWAINKEEQRYRLYREFSSEGAKKVAGMEVKPERWFFTVQWLGEERPDMHAPVVRDSCGCGHEDDRNFFVVVSIPYRPGHMTACRVAWYLQYLHGNAEIEADLPSIHPPVAGCEGGKISHYVQGVWEERLKHSDWQDRAEIEAFYGKTEKENVSNDSGEEKTSTSSGPDLASWLKDTSISAEEKTLFLEATLSLLRLQNRREKSSGNRPAVSPSSGEQSEEETEAEKEEILSSLSLPGGM